MASSFARRGDSDAGWALPRKPLGDTPGSFHKLSLTHALPRWGNVFESANVCGAGPLGDRSLPRKPLGDTPEFFRKLSLTRALPRWGDVFESANVCGHGTPQSRPATAPDRSEIGPYLGSLWATPQSSSANSASPTHFRGGAISPKAPGPQAWNTAEQARRSTGPLSDRSQSRRAP